METVIIKHGKKATPVEAGETPDYDTAWKYMIETHFEEFLLYFFPHIHRDINFSIKPDFKSNELKRIIPRAKVGGRHADVLVKVYLKDGTCKCICVFLHVEVQGTRDANLMERVFVYYYRVHDKYYAKGAKIISLMVLTDEDKNYRPKGYHVNLWGFNLRMIIPFVKIIDYKYKKKMAAELNTSTSPMALVVKVILESFVAKKGDNTVKFNIKRELIRQLYSHGYAGDYIRSLLYCIDLVIHLPEGLEKELEEEIIKIEEGNDMNYVTSWERIAIKETTLKTKLEMALAFLKSGTSMDIVVNNTGLPREEIEKAAAKASSVD